MKVSKFKGPDQSPSGDRAGEGVQALAEAVGGGAHLCLDGAEPEVGEGLRVPSRGNGGLDVLGHDTLTGEAAGQGRLRWGGRVLRQPLGS